MHDPETLVYGCWLFEIWHIDPERGGNDDSCDWFGCHRKLRPDELAILKAADSLSTLLDNPPHYPASREHRRFRVLMEAIRRWAARPYLRVHPRWHLWHWSIHLHFVEAFKRWAFSRCCRCGKGFRWGEAPMSGWGGNGPKWFRSEQSIWHEGCQQALTINDAGFVVPVERNTVSR